MAPSYVDLNCDLGESFGRWSLGYDEAIMPHITSGNLACGFHAGDPHVMRRTVELAVQHGVAVGAQPGLPDLLGFGRRLLDVSPRELKDYHTYQLGALWAFTHAAGTPLQHVKPHGIQYTMFERSPDLGRAAAEAALEFDSTLVLLAMAGSTYERTAREAGARVAAEGFADRPYTRTGELVWPRQVITEPARAAEQAVMLAREGRVRTVDGAVIEARVHSICIHGETPGADRIVLAVRQALEAEGLTIRPLRDWL